MLDASSDRGAATRAILQSYAAACEEAHIAVWHEADHPPASHGDQAVRNITLELLRARFGPERWVMLCHADEYWYHEPAALAARSVGEGCTAVGWYALHVLPHPSEFARYVDLQRHREFARFVPLQARFQHFHYGPPKRRGRRSAGKLGFSTPYIEWRLFRDGAGVRYVESSNGTLPAKGLKRCACRCTMGTYRERVDCVRLCALRVPAYLHYKVPTPNPALYSTSGRHVRHWQGAGAIPVGLFGFRPRNQSDFFVSRYDDYAESTIFTGCAELQKPNPDQACPEADL